MPPTSDRFGALGVAWAEVTASKEYRIAEFLRFSDRFIEQTRRDSYVVPRSFAFDEYLQHHAAQNLKELVRLEPTTVALTWAPVAVASLAAELIGLSAGGLPYGPPSEATYLREVSSIELTVVGAQLALGLWACANLVRMASIKALLRPQLTTKRSAAGGTTRRLVPPAYTLCGGVPHTGWGALRPIASLLEERFAVRARNPHEELFGSIGAAGPAYYLESQKLVLFNAIVSIAASVVFVADGAPVPLLCAGLVPATLAILLATPTFLAYNWVTAVEQLKDQKAMRRVLQAQRQRAFNTKLTTLLRMCDLFDRAAAGEVCQLQDQTP